MKSIVSLFILFSVVYLSAYAQPQGGNRQQTGEPIGVLKGKIIDSAANEAVEYANIVVFKTKDSSMVNGTVSDEKGQFRIEKLTFGSYYAEISFLGFNKKRLPSFVINPKNQEKDLGTINIQSSSSSLSEVTVTSERKTVEFKLDKKVVNVEKSLTTAGGTAVDVLQNVPSVTVDADGAVSLRGSSNVTILIDGRPSILSGTNLEQIPASSIESIEVITNPSARYNPEGMTGILNIKLKKKIAAGFNGMVTVGAGTRDKYNGSINLNYSTKYVNLFSSFDSRYNRRTGSGTMDRTTFSPDTIVLDQSMHSLDKGFNNSIKLGADFKLNPTNTLTFTWLTNFSNETEDENTEYDNFINGDTIMSESDNSQNNHDISQDYTLSYRKTYPRKDQELTFDAVYTTFSNSENADIRETAGRFETSSIPAEMNKTNSDNTSDNLTLQLNYIHPFTEKMKIETGFQSVMRSMDNDFKYSTFDRVSGNWNMDANLTNRFKYSEQYHAVYGMFATEWNNLTFQVGLRLEQAYTKGEQKTTNETNDKQYFNFFPTAHITRKFGNNNDVQLSYSKRINRPNMNLLNPFADYTNPTTIRMGNPDLNPEYFNAIELGHTKTWDKLMLNSTIFYRQTNDAIRRILTVDSLNIGHVTVANLSKGVSYGIEFIADYEIQKWWRTSLNFSYFRNKIDGESDGTVMTNDNYSWTSKFNTNIYFTKSTMMQFNVMYRGPMVTPQGEMAQMAGCDIAFKQDLWKEKASLSIRVSDIFNTMKFQNTNSGETYTAKMVRKRETRNAFFTFTYKIGSGAKQKQRKVIQEQRMDDAGE